MYYVNKNEMDTDLINFINSYYLLSSSKRSSYISDSKNRDEPIKEDTNAIPVLVFGSSSINPRGSRPWPGQ